MGWLTNRYNKKTSKKYGWLPSWFGEDLDSFDSDLEAAVKAFQKDHDLSDPYPFDIKLKIKSTT